MYKKFLIVCLVMFSYNLYSQPNNVNEEGNVFQTGNLDAPFLRVSKTSGNNIEGSIYLEEEWKQATVTDLTNKKAIKLLARFNAYHSEIEILKEKDITALYPKDGISVNLNNRNFTPIKVKNKEKPIFAERLVKGAYNLFKVYDIKIIKAPSDAKLLNLESIDRVEITHDFYYGQQDGDVLEIPTNKRAIKSEMPDALLTIGKKEKLSFKKEEDLIKIFSMVNSM